MRRLLRPPANLRIAALRGRLGKNDVGTDHMTGVFGGKYHHQIIGTTRARVSFFMNKFRRLGFIDYKEGLKVHRALLTIVLHD